MGKNQAYKAMQRSKVSDGSSGIDQIEDGMVDGSFHSPEWHAARLASLGTSHTVTWEEFKRKQKEDEMKKGEVEADKDRMMKEYRAQLDAERAIKLAKGRNHSNTKSDRKKDKEKESRKRSKKHKRSRRHSESSSSSEYSSSESEERESRKSKSRSKHKEKRHRSRSKTSSRRGEKDEEASGEGGPLPLSRFFGNMKN